jgi:polysaccharide export outer membrane protein
MQLKKVFLLLTTMSLANCMWAQGPGLPIHSGDLVHIEVANTPEMESTPRVTDAGQVPVLGAGNVKVAGLSPADAAAAIQARLVQVHYLNHPEVTLTVEQYATQNVSVMGEVKSAGAYSITTARPVLDVLALAGGLTPEADRNILVARQGDTDHPLHYYVSNDGRDALSKTILVNPGDTIVVPRAGIVYILGDVNRPGGYVMSNNESQLTLLQAFALAGGATRAAKQKHAYLIRKVPGGYQDTKFSLVDFEVGKRADMALVPGDVLYVPFSFGRNLVTTGGAGIAAAAASASVYAIP